MKKGVVILLRNWVVILNWNQVLTLNWNWVVNITGICILELVFAESSISLMKKVTKKYSWIIIVFLVFMNLRFQPQYFYNKNHRTNFSIATPAARVLHSPRGSLPSANAEILTVIFWCKNIRATKR